MVSIVLPRKPSLVSEDRSLGPRMVINSLKSTCPSPNEHTHTHTQSIKLSFCHLTVDLKNKQTWCLSLTDWRYSYLLIVRPAATLPPSYCLPIFPVCEQLFMLIYIINGLWSLCQALQHPRPEGRAHPSIHKMTFWSLNLIVWVHV